MMKILLRNERKIIFNTFRTQKRSNLFSYLIALIILAGFLYFLSKTVWSVSGEITEPVLESLLSYVSLVIVGFIILLGVPQVFKDMYSTRDLELLFTLPITTRHIFWIKYMRSFAGIPLLAFIFLCIPLFVYGIATNASLLFYPVVLLVLLAVTIIGLSIAYLLNLILIQIVPASRANELVTVMSVLSGLIVYLMFMLPNLMNDEPMTDAFLTNIPLLPKWVPFSWGGTSLVESANGSMSFLLPLIMLVLLAVISVIATISFVEKGFRTGWIRLSEGSNKKKKKQKSNVNRTVGNPILAIGKKEWFSIKRDIREWLVLMPIAMFFIFGMIGYFSSGGNLSDIRGYNEISWPVAQLIILFIYAFSGATIAASAVGREGASLWVLRMLPLTGTQIALGKVLISWLLPFMILSVIEVVIGIFLGWTLIQFVGGIMIKAIITVGFSAIGFWLGTIGAKYNPTNPQQRVSFAVSLLLLISSLIYLVIALIPYGYIIIPLEEIDLPANLEHGMTGFKGMISSIVLKLLYWKSHSPILLNIVGFIGQMFVSIGVASLFIWLSAKRIDKGIKIDLVSESSAKPLFGGGKKSGGSLY